MAFLFRKRKLYFCLHTFDLILSLIVVCAITAKTTQLLRKITNFAQIIKEKDEKFWNGTSIRNSFVDFRLEGHKFSYGSTTDRPKTHLQKTIKALHSASMLGIFQLISLDLLFTLFLLVINLKHAIAAVESVYHTRANMEQETESKAEVRAIGRMNQIAYLSSILVVAYTVAVCVHIDEYHKDTLLLQFIGLLLIASFYRLGSIVFIYIIRMKDKRPPEPFPSEQP